MKVATGLLAGVAVFAMAQAADAAPPKLQGKYAVMIFEQCTASFAAPSATFLRPTPPGGSGPAVRVINSQQNGEFGVEVGTMTFPAAAPVAFGNATIALTGARGHALRINGGGSAVTVQTDTLSGPFTITPTTFSFTPTGQPKLTWTASYGNIAPVSGLVRTMYMVRKDGNSCVQAIQATKQ
jgi:hypothetical protein